MHFKILSENGRHFAWGLNVLTSDGKPALWEVVSPGYNQAEENHCQIFAQESRPKNTLHN